MTRIEWILKQFSKQLWLRVALFAVLGILTALFAFWYKDIVPEGVSQKIGAYSVDKLLNIIASSMLTVTTFSLSIMVSAYSAATTNVTPHSTQLLQEDTTAQTALSVFIGAFLFSLVGLIALSMQIYGDQGRAILFIVTILVIAIIVFVMIKWIAYLSDLGRVSTTIHSVEKAAQIALLERIQLPNYGGQPLDDHESMASYFPIFHEQLGFVKNVDVNALSKLATKVQASFYLQKLPGMFNDGVEPIAYCNVALSPAQKQSVCDAFIIGNSRSFDQDPRFGLTVLGEIASRALSPAVNDSGTALDTIGVSVKIMSLWTGREKRQVTPIFKNVFVPELKDEDLFYDAFAGIARDGASNFQIGMMLQKALHTLATNGDKASRAASVKLSIYALDYADKQLLLECEKEQLREFSEKHILSSVK